MNFLKIHKHINLWILMVYSAENMALILKSYLFYR